MIFSMHIHIHIHVYICEHIHHIPTLHICMCTMHVMMMMWCMLYYIQADMQTHQWMNWMDSHTWMHSLPSSSTILVGCIVLLYIHQISLSPNEYTSMDRLLRVD